MYLTVQKSNYSVHNYTRTFCIIHAEWYQVCFVESLTSLYSKRERALGRFLSQKLEVFGTLRRESDVMFLHFCTLLKSHEAAYLQYNLTFMCIFLSVRLNLINKSQRSLFLHLWVNLGTNIWTVATAHLLFFPSPSKIAVVYLYLTSFACSLLFFNFWPIHNGCRLSERFREGFGHRRQSGRMTMRDREPRAGIDTKKKDYSVWKKTVSKPRQVTPVWT